MKTQGMTLIEVIVALSVSSMLALMLYQTFSQSQRAGLMIDAQLDYEVAMPIMYNQLDKDISSLFVPEQVFSELMQKDKEKQKNRFKNIFVCSLKDKNVESLSFLSTHSLSLFNTIVPRSVRVLYRLAPAANGLFTLMRQESTKLDLSLAKFKEDKIPEYELMRGLKEFSLELIVPEKTSDKGEAKKSEEKKYKSLHAWQPDEAETAEKKPEALIPEFVIVKGRVMHELSGREYAFEWWFKVPVFANVAERVEAIKNPKKTAQQQAVPPPVPPGQNDPINPGGYNV